MKTERRGRLRAYGQVVFLLVLTLTTMSCASAQGPTPTPKTNKRPTLDNTILNIGPQGNQAPPAGEATGGVQTYPLPMNGRNMSYRVIFPTGYNTAGDRYPVVYLLHGLTGHFNDWTDRSKLVEIAAKYRFIIVMPEGNDGWYSDNPVIPTDKYESYIIGELIPEVDKRFHTNINPAFRVIAGLSMGGYGALKFGLRYRDKKFGIVGSFSGAFVTGTWSESIGGNKLIGRSLDRVYGPPKGPAREKEDIFKIAQNIKPGHLTELPYIYLACGTEDVFIKVNREFVNLLNQKGLQPGLNYEEHFTRGGHTWPYWGEQVKVFLEVVNQKLNPPPVEGQ